MNPEPADETDTPTEMDRWAIPLFEAAPPEQVPVTEEDYPLRLESMPEEGFHPQLRFFRAAG